MKFSSLDTSFLHLKKNGRLLGFGSSAKRDWKIMFIFGLVLLVLVVALSVWVYLREGKEGTSVESSTPSVDALNAQIIEHTALYYHDKAVRLEELKKTKESHLDPSQ